MMSCSHRRNCRICGARLRAYAQVHQSQHRAAEKYAGGLPRAGVLTMESSGLPGIRPRGQNLSLSNALRASPLAVLITNFLRTPILLERTSKRVAKPVVPAPRCRSDLISTPRARSLSRRFITNASIEQSASLPVWYIYPVSLLFRIRPKPYIHRAFIQW